MVYYKIFDESMTAKIKLWSYFHKFQSSREFTSAWENYLSQLHINAEPMYYQHVTEEVFEALIEKQCMIVEGNQQTSETIRKMSFEEENTVHFVGGYVVRSLRDAQKLSKDKSVLDILNGLVYSKEEEHKGGGSQTWMNTIKRWSCRNN